MLEYLKYSERGYFMKNNVKEIMKEYKEGIEKIDNAYKVEKVEKNDFSEINKKIEYEKHFIGVLESEAKGENKALIERAKERLEKASKEKEEKEKVEKIDLSEINKKIEYEKHFIEVLESEAKEENKVLIERAKERLEEASKEKEEKEKQNAEIDEKNEKNKNDKAKLRNEKVILPSGREVTRAEKDKIEKNYLKDTAIRKLTQESKNISEEITKKDKELKENIDKKMNFRYEFEKDAEGKSTGKVLNEKELDGIIATIHNLKKDMTELNGMQAECQKYLEELKQKDQEKMDEVAKAWNNVKPEEKEVETKQVSEPQTNSQSQTSSEQSREGNSQPNNNDINGLEENILRQTQLEEQEGKNGNSQNEQPKVDTEKNGSEQPETDIDENEEKEAEKPGIVIARKVTITNKQNFFGVGKIGKIFKKDNEDKIANLKTIFTKGKEETLNDIAENVDPAIIEGVIELRKRNMLTEKQAQKAIINLATGSATKENLDFTIEYNMKDLSKWAFLPWNRGVRDQIAKVAEENRENEIAEFTDGVEYEPNPIKRMMARVKQKKLGNGKEKEDNVEEKTSKVSNVFKKRIKDEAQKSDYEQLRDDIIAGKDVESLDEIIKKAKEATRTGKISTTELQNLMNNAETMKKDIASRENEEPEEKKVIINDPQEMEK